MASTHGCNGQRTNATDLVHHTTRVGGSGAGAHSSVDTALVTGDPHEDTIRTAFLVPYSNTTKHETELLRYQLGWVRDKAKTIGVGRSDELVLAYVELKYGDKKLEAEHRWERVCTARQKPFSPHEIYREISRSIYSRLRLKSPASIMQSRASDLEDMQALFTDMVSVERHLACGRDIRAQELPLELTSALERGEVPPQYKNFVHLRWLAPIHDTIMAQFTSAQ